MDGQGGLSDQDNMATMAKRRAFEAWFATLDLGHVPGCVSWPPFCIAGNLRQPDLCHEPSLAPISSFLLVSMFFLCVGFVPKTPFD